MFAEPSKRIREVLWGQIDARHVAIVRILAMTVWLHDLVRMGPFVALHYDPPIGTAYLWYWLWVTVTVVVLIGYRARLFSAIGFVVSTVLVTADHVIYHIDYYVLLTFFYFMFIESDRAWSFSAWKRARSRSQPGGLLWAGPVNLLSMQLAFIYLNSGLAHLMLNRSWREGYALSQSFANPVWRSPVGELFAYTGLPTWPMDLATLILELSFAPLWLVALWKPQWHLLRLVLGGSIILFHVGIAVFLNIGAFSHYVIATAVVFLPTKWLLMGTAPEKGVLKPAERDLRKLVLAVLGFFVALALVLHPPLDIAVEGSGAAARLLERAKRTLALTGDARHHNVFPEVVTERVFYIVTYFEGEERTEMWPLLFDERGERVGWATDMRIFMSLRLPLRGLGMHTVLGRPLRAGDARRALDIAIPLLRRDVSIDRNRWVQHVRLETRAYFLGRSLSDDYVAGPSRLPVSCFDVERRGDEILLERVACRSFSTR